MSLKFKTIRSFTKKKKNNKVCSSLGKRQS